MNLFEETTVEKVMIMNIEDLDKYCNRSLNRDALTEAEYRSAPFDDYCLQVFFYQLQTSLRRFNEWEEIVYTTIYVIISILAVIGNGLVIIAVLWKKAMRTNRNVLILNLALSNLVLALINIPFLWLPSIDFEFPYSRFFCKIANVLPGSNIYCSTLTISVMAIDRYYSVKQLKVASNRRQCMKAICVSLSIWVVSFLLSLPLLLYYDTTMLYVVKDVNVLDEKGGIKLRSYGWRQCRLAPSRSTTLEMSTQEIQLLMSLLQVVSLYIVPLFVLSIFNVKLTRFLKTNANQMAKNRSESRRRRDGDGSKRNGEIGTRSQSNPSLRSSIAERASDRRTSRTTALLIAMAGSYAALWLPFTLISLLLDLDILYGESHVAVIERIDQTCKMVSMLSICVNPFLYGFLNTNFRHEFSEIYFRYVLCRAKTTGQARFQHDFSSLAVNTRRNSVYVGVNEENTGLCSILRRSFIGSVDRLRSPMRHQPTSSSISNKQQSSTAATEYLLPETDHLGCDRIVLDADSEKDSFV
ncbi:unnamed protein product [Cylicocyclus nassatus]|uniref:G-protein coupled receptors family 1 profile domain-containing protein n=1 Tax=Cylicocyclus nassatus TaxID=53992 RepID=A0AA36HFL4_CYLNA|nr:unnamed protein product [Cylicocyclus nassatus]